jgi:Ca-activated chloride channel family protein
VDDEIKSSNERQMIKHVLNIFLKNKIIRALPFGKLTVAFTCIFLMHTSAYSQSERKLVKDGNQMYKDKKYSDAEVNYKKSLDVNKDSKPAQFNLGDAYYKQGKYDEATKQFETLSSDGKLDKEEKAKAFHNLGNSYLQSKKYDESVNAYKNALKLNPKDNETRYNLAYAQSMIQQQQQQQQKKNQDKDNKDNKDKKDDKKDQDQQQQQKDQQQKGEEKKDEQKQAKRDKISKEDAEKILQALNNDEKNTQKKLTKKDATRIAIDKKW